MSGYFGVAPSTPYTWKARGRLPAPDVTVSGRPGWYESTLDAWAGATGRQATAGMGGNH
jgi:predicted DNA-binding transcriptional regulator AlpA